MNIKQQIQNYAKKNTHVINRSSYVKKRVFIRQNPALAHALIKAAK